MESILSAPLLVVSPLLERSTWKVRLHHFACWICDWWEDTTHPSFYKSSANGRYSLYLLLPTLSLSGIFCDIAQGGSPLVLSLDAASAVAAIAALFFLDTAPIIADAAITGIFISLFLAVRVLGEFGCTIYEDEVSGDVLSTCVCIYLIFLAGSGVHASCTMLGWLCNMVFCIGVSSGTSIAQVCIFPIICWLMISHQTSRWQAYMDVASNKAFLQHASDGILTVCVASSTILSVGELADSRLSLIVHPGSRLSALIESSDICKLQELMSRASAHVFSSILVTFCSPLHGVVMDCKLTSHRFSGRKVAISMVAVGEVRPLAAAQAVDLDRRSMLRVSADSQASNRNEEFDSQAASRANQIDFAGSDVVLSVDTQVQGKQCRNITTSVDRNSSRRRFVDIAGDCYSELSVYSPSILSFDSALQQTLQDAWNVTSIESLLTANVPRDLVNEAQEALDLINAQGTYASRRAVARSYMERFHRHAVEALQAELDWTYLELDVQHRREELDDRNEFVLACTVARERIRQDVWSAQIVFRFSNAFRGRQVCKPLFIVCEMLGGAQVRPRTGTFCSLQGILTRVAVSTQIGRELAVQIGLSV